MFRKLSLFALVFGLTLVAAPSFADAPACYSYDCTGQTCTFEATCSTASHIWRVWYDFGDGNSSGLTSPNTSIDHTYLTRAQGGPAYPPVTLTIITFGGPILTVTCEMPVNQAFGPPLLPYGTCE